MYFSETKKVFCFSIAFSFKQNRDVLYWKTTKILINIKCNFAVIALLRCVHTYRVLQQQTDRKCIHF